MGSIRIRCPVCGVRQRLEHVLKALPPIGHAPYWTPERLAEHLRAGEIKWACEGCLASGRALPADPTRQTFGIAGPLLAYYDVPLTCADCGQPFTFRAAEQRFWYEHLGFTVHARPKQCPPCRKRRRERNEAAAQLSAILPELDRRDPSQLIRMAELYLRMGVKQKGIEYLRRAKNVANDPEMVRELLTRIEALERSP